MKPEVWERGQWRATDIRPDDVLVVNLKKGVCRVKRESAALRFHIGGKRVRRVPFRVDQIGDDVIQLLVDVSQQYDVDLSGNGAIDWVLQAPSVLDHMFNWRRYTAVLAESLRQAAP